jgi:outer membrane biosynthesis protein TonB
LLIHFLFVLLFWILGTITPEIKKTKPDEEKRIKVSLKEYPKQKAKDDIGTVKKAPPPKERIKPMPKGSQLDKIIKKPSVKYKPKAKPKKPKLNKKPKITKPKKVVKKTSPLPPNKPYIPLKKIKEPKKITKKDNSLYSMLAKEDANQEDEVVKQKSYRGGNIGKNIRKLYGDEFGKLTPGQQEYILDNQEIMRRITQEVLNRQARVSNIENINANTVNVIEFYLHPNGDMSDFRFLKKSGYYMLDDITKATIEYAYSKYPRPKEKTLIRYNVFYNLARRY